jgi:probable F420-dependent oxidoreductase
LWNVQYSERSDGVQRRTWGKRVQFGLKLTTYGRDIRPEDLLGLAMVADRTGMDSVWVSDHVVIPDTIGSQYPVAALAKKFSPELTRVSFEPIALLSVIAGASSRLRLGTSILVASQREPLLLAKQLSTLDVLSGGRVHLGVGAGWMREEFAALGVGFKQRWSRLEETVDILKLVWSAEPVVSYHGSQFTFDPLHFFPKPVQAGGIPITVGGHGPRALRLAGRAGGWNTFGIAPHEVRAGVNTMSEGVERADRDPARLRVVFRGTLLGRNDAPDPDVPWNVGGSPEHMADVVHLYREAGVTEMTFNLAPALSVAEGQEVLEYFAEARAHLSAPDVLDHFPEAGALLNTPGVV